MVIHEKDYLRIYARKAILETKEWKLILQQGKVTDYVGEIDLRKQVSCCRENLLITEQEEHDRICIRPVVIEKNTSFSILWEGISVKTPVLIEIASCNTADDVPRELFFLCHEKGELLFREKDGSYEITYIGQSEALNDCCKGVQGQEFTPKQFVSLWEETKKRKDQILEESRNQISQLTGELEQLEEQQKQSELEKRKQEDFTRKLEQELKDLQNKDERLLLEIEQNEQQNKKNRAVLEVLQKESKKPEEERKKVLKGLQGELEFLEQVGVYYPTAEVKTLLQKAQKLYHLLEEREQLLAQPQI